MLSFYIWFKLALASPIVEHLSYGIPIDQSTPETGPLAELASRDIDTSTLEDHTLYQGDQYYGQFKLGSKGRLISVRLDTGSYTLNLYQDQYDPTTSDTSINTTKPFESCYGDDVHTSCSDGFQYIDNLLTLGGLNASSFAFDLSLTSSAVEVVGMAPVPLDQDYNTSFINQLYRTNQIETRSFSMWLAGYTKGGQVVYGGVDHAKYTGNLTLVPMQTDANGNPSANTFVRKVWAYNQCGERGLVYEGITELGFDSGSGGGYTPTILNNALQIAFNATLASTQPEALAAGFDASTYVVKYMGGGGYILDICGIELKIDMAKFLRSPNGVRNKNPTIGSFYGIGLTSPSSNTTFELGIPTFFDSVYYVADWDRKQLAFAQAAGSDQALSTSTVEPIGSTGVPRATSASYYSETSIVATPTTYSTNIFRSVCTESSTDVFA